MLKKNSHIWAAKYYCSSRDTTEKIGALHSMFSFHAQAVSLLNAPPHFLSTLCLQFPKRRT